MLYVTLDKRIKRNDQKPKMCEDCYSVKTDKPKPRDTQYELKGNCISHKGDLDLHTMLPLDKKGNFINRGYRLCGNLDCVNEQHITKDKTRAMRWLGKEIPNLVRNNPDVDPAELYAIAKPHPKNTVVVCQVKTCQNNHSSAGLCDKHKAIMQRYAKANNLPLPGRYKEPSPSAYLRPTIHFGGHGLKVSDTKCNVPDCVNRHKTRGLCHRHYTQHMREKHGRKKVN